MASILTNNSAMVALQTLRGINSSLTQTQNQIATGKEIASAKDNSAIWAISKVMESDVNSFKAISSSLNLGESTVAVARQASETVADLLTKMKGKIVAAQEENVDRAKIQVDINSMRDQINSIVSGAQFSGLNLVKGTDSLNILGSLDRASDGSVTANNIRVQRQDLTATAGTFGGGTALNANATVSDTTSGGLSNGGNTAVLTFNDNADYSGASFNLTVAGVALSFGAGELGADDEAAVGIVASRINALGIDGVTASAGAAGGSGTLTIRSTRSFEGLNVTIDNAGGNAAGTAISAVNGAAPTGANSATNSTIAERAESITFNGAASVNDGDGYRVSFGGETFTYVAGPSETFEDVAKGLQAAIGGTNLDGITTSVTKNDAGNYVLKIDNGSGNAMTLAAIGNAGGVASGGLFGLDQIDVTTDTGASAALSNIETLINTAIDGAAAFGSAQGRIELQAEFVSKLSDSLKSGIGTLIDADLEEASARLQALQVQQQLGIQSLSIANQQPQSILSLFR